MKTSYFTLGQSHIYKHNGHVLDCNSVIKITAEDLREVMFEFFGSKWAFEYKECPDMKYFPRGIYNLTENKWEKQRTMDTDKNYPSWLVPIETARKLKELGFKERCLFAYDNQRGLTIETSSLHEPIIEFDDLLFDENNFDDVVSVPTYEQVFEWFASRGWLGVIISLDTCDYSYRVVYRNVLVVDVKNTYIKSYSEIRERLVDVLVRLYNDKGFLV